MQCQTKNWFFIRTQVSWLHDISRLPKVFYLFQYTLSFAICGPFYKAIMAVEQDSSSKGTLYIMLQGGAPRVTLTKKFCDQIFP